MSRFNFFRRGNQNDNSDENYEYYEDTHDDSGDYTARLRSFQRSSENDRPASRLSSFESPLNAYHNIMVYEPHTSQDVQKLIDFLKTRESAIVNLENVEDEISQRVLDFVSGAIYALNGSVHRISGNIFLLSPQGVGITNGNNNDEEK